MTKFRLLIVAALVISGSIFASAQTARQTFELGLDNYKKKNYEVAISRFKRAIELDPNFHEAYFYLGNCHFDLKKYPLAIEAFQNAVRVKPDYFEALLRLGNSLNKIGRSNEAVEVFQ